MKHLILSASALVFALCVAAQSDEGARRAYSESLCYREAEDYAAQMDLLTLAHSLSPTDPDILHDMAQVYESMYMDSLAAEFYRRALQNVPPAAREQKRMYTADYALFLMNTGEWKQAVATWKPLTETPSALRDEAYEMLVRCYEQLGQADSMLLALDRWALVAGEEQSVQILKLRSLERLGRMDDAVSLARELWNLYPTEIYYASLYGEILLSAGDTLAARDHLNTLKETDSGEPAVQLLEVHLAQCIHNREYLVNAIEQMILNPQVEPSMRRDFMQSIISSLSGTTLEYRVGEIFLSLMQLPLTSTVFPQMYAAWLSSNNAPMADYSVAMQKWIEVDPSADVLIYQMWMQQALVQEDYNTATRQCRMAIESHPEKLWFYGVAAMALRKLGQKDEALNLMREGLPYVNQTEDGDEVSDFYGSLGDILQYAGRTDEAFQAYDSALVYNPLNVVALNNYAYFLSVENVRLEDAKRMCSAVMQIEPDNPTYIDTYAWILYRLEDYETARRQIDQAMVRMLDSDEESRTVYEHAADIYEALGKANEAQDYRLKALSLPNE